MRGRQRGGRAGARAVEGDRHHSRVCFLFFPLFLQQSWQWASASTAEASLTSTSTPGSMLQGGKSGRVVVEASQRKKKHAFSAIWARRKRPDHPDVPDRGDLLDNLRGRVEVDEALVQAHLEPVPGVGTCGHRGSGGKGARGAVGTQQPPAAPLFWYGCSAPPLRRYFPAAAAARGPTPLPAQAGGAHRCRRATCGW